jgi:hypothetical protein
MLFFHHTGKTSSIPPPVGGLSAAIVVVARRWKEYHVVAAVERHELKTPETEHRPGLERSLETAHLELDGKLLVNTQHPPTWRASCLNIIYAETLRLLRVDLSSVRAGAAPFHGIIPGKRV